MDGRSGVPNEPGNIWVAWDADPPTVVCVYLTVDSVVGQRLFFAQSLNASDVQTRGTISLASGAIGHAGDNAIPYLTDTALPSSVYAYVNGAQINAGFTDIRPEDGLYATLRAQCTRNAGLTCLGYGPSPIGTAVQSAFSATQAQVVNYALTGTDPISGLTVGTATTIPIGADPMIMFVNTGTGSPFVAGDFNTLNPTNINSHTTAAVFSGLLTRTTDVTGSLGTTGSPLAVVFREPTSGTYNTFEWQIVRAKGTVLSQETGVNPASNSCAAITGSYPSPETYLVPATACGNPANVIAADGGTRSRAIGTGELVNAVNKNKNAIGYAFWSFATFNPAKYPNIKYLALDGVDPLFANYSGVTPTCSGTAPAITCSTSVTFPNIQAGNYRNWSLLRVLIPSSVTYAGSFYQTFIQAAQDQASSKIADFVPFLVNGVGNLKVFRSHYSLASVGIGASPLNGTNQTAIGPYPAFYEQGGDMAGAVFPVQADVDYSADNGAGVQLVGYIQ